MLRATLSVTVHKYTNSKDKHICKIFVSLLCLKIILGPQSYNLKRVSSYDPDRLGTDTFGDGCKLGVLSGRKCALSVKDSLAIRRANRNRLVPSRK